MKEGREDWGQDIGHLRVKVVLLVANKILAWRVPCLVYSGGETCYTVSFAERARPGLV
jgi:hypothetical protein